MSRDPLPSDEWVADLRERCEHGCPEVSPLACEPDETCPACMPWDGDCPACRKGGSDEEEAGSYRVWCPTLGQTEADGLDISVESLEHPDHPEDAAELWARRFDAEYEGSHRILQGELGWLELVIRCPNGELDWCQVSGAIRLEYIVSRLPDPTLR